MLFRYGVALGLAFALQVMGSAAPVIAAPDSCQVSGSLVTCTGDHSDGIFIDEVGSIRLRVEDLTEDIDTPGVGTAIDVTTGGNAVIRPVCVVSIDGGNDAFVLGRQDARVRLFSRVDSGRLWTAVCQ